MRTLSHLIILFGVCGVAGTAAADNKSTAKSAPLATWSAAQPSSASPSLPSASDKDSRASAPEQPASLAKLISAQSPPPGASGPVRSASLAAWVTNPPQPEAQAVPDRSSGDDCPAMDCCGCQCDRSGWTGGAGWYLLKPFADDNQAYSTTTTGAGNNATRNTTDFTWDYTSSPLVWLGYQTADGWGVRSRFFYFDENSSLATVANAAGSGTTIRPSLRLPDADMLFGVGAGSPGFLGSPIHLGTGTDRLGYTSGLSLNYVDFEATYDLCEGQYTFFFSGGARYLHYSQRYDQFLASGTTIMGDRVTENSVLDFVHDFNGAGPTVALQACRQLGASRLSLFGTVRGSLLVGSAGRALSFNQVIYDPGQHIPVDPGNRSTAITATASQTKTLPVGEIEVGVEYAMQSFGQLNPFLRFAVVDQTYFGAGAASHEDGNLSLFGVQSSLGVNY